jgi:osmotically-inducible protein OsmY
MNFKHGFNLKNASVVMMAVFVPIVIARAESRPDAWITTQAESALHSAGGGRVSSVHVDTTNGRVTLFGKVRSEGDKASAAADVRNVAGVRGVRNLLQVVGPGNSARVRRSDDAVERDVARTLRTDRSLDDSSITVKSVSNGVVLLSGNVASSNDNVRALRTTANRPGVRRVFSEIEAVDAIGAPNGTITAGGPMEVAPSIRPVPIVAQDEVIRRGVKSALNDLDARENAAVDVRVKDGIVWLSGSVPTWQGNSSRLDAARSVTGVRSVINELRIGALIVNAR